MAIKSFVKGNLVRVSMTLKDTAEVLLDPTGLTFTFRNPAGNSTNWVFGIDSELVKDSVGNYHADIDADQDGKWFYRWESTGDGKAANEGEFNVKRSFV